MTLTCPFKLTRLSHEWLTGWKGPAGAAYNVIYEDLREAGLICRDGTITQKGDKAIREYVPEPEQLSLGL